MPIRIEPDQPQPNRDRRPSQDDRPSGGIPSWLKLIPFLLIFVRKPGKWIIILAVIFGLYYLWQNMGSYTEDSEEQAVSDFQYQTQRGEELTLGENFNQAQYELTLANEPLAVGYGSSLPSSANLETYAPRRLNQGYQGSCSGWAIAYAARTISYARATGQSPTAVAYIRKARKALGSALSPAEAAMKGFSRTAEITALEASDRANFRDREIAELSSHVEPTHERGKKKWVLKMLSRAKDAALTFVYGRIDSRAAWEMFSVEGPRFN